MAKHVQGIAIVIKAFLPTGKTLDEQFAALGMVKDAHASGDYSKVLAAAKIDEVKSEQKTRRVDDEPATTGQEQASEAGETAEEETNEKTETEEQSSDGVPEFLKKSKRSASAA